MISATPVINSGGFSSIYINFSTYLRFRRTDEYSSLDSNRKNDYLIPPFTNHRPNIRVRCVNTMSNKRAARRQDRETASVKSVEETHTQSVSVEDQVPTDSSTTTEEHVDPLMADVKTFLSKRDELARKFAEEIDALEQRLAELKETAASLFPENLNNGTPDRKPKKPKTKASSKSESTSAVESSTSSE